MKWRANNPDKAGTYNARRAQTELEGDATPQFIEAKWEASNKTCILCGDPIEHPTPLIRGGRHDLDNIDFAHYGCNSSKGAKTLEEHREWQDKIQQAS